VLGRARRSRAVPLPAPKGFAMTRMIRDSVFGLSLVLLCVTAVPAPAQPAPAGARPTSGNPLTMKDLESLEKVMLFTAEDVKYLRMSKDVLADQVEAILDVWYGFVAATPELVYFFGNKATGKPDAAYLAAVRKRFARWILDTAAATYDQAWLDYQYEIGLRHNALKKNQTDRAPSVAQVNLRYLSALTIPVTTTLRPFLAKKGAAAADVDKMHQAWIKSVLMQTILWSQPYVKPGQF
jgi:hypothetical protein